MNLSSSRPRALLVNPWFHDFAAYDFWARPLGLLGLAAALREAGWEVSLIDCLNPFYPGRTRPLPRRRGDGSGKFDAEEIEKPAALADMPRRFKRYGVPVPAFRALCSQVPRPDLVLVASVMTYWWTGVRETIAEIKNFFPETPVVLGGVYATLLPEHAQSFTGADYVAPGDFHHSLPPLLSKLGLPSQLSRQDRFPAWDLYEKFEGAALLTGRGCPFHCAYCAVPTLQPRLQRREPAAVVGEVERLHREFGVMDIAFYDDALRAGGDGHLTALLEGIVRLGLPVRFHAVNALHLRGLSRELAVLMRRARLATLRFGLEAADRERSLLLGDKADLEDLKIAVGHLRAAGYESGEIGVYLLAGLPGQPRSELESGVRAVISAGARPFLSEFSPTPASPVFAEAARRARLDLKAEPLYHNNSLLACAEAELDGPALSGLKKLAREPFGPAREA